MWQTDISGEGSSFLCLVLEMVTRDANIFLVIVARVVNEESPFLFLGVVARDGGVEGSSFLFLFLEMVHGDVKGTESSFLAICVEVLGEDVQGAGSSSELSLSPVWSKDPFHRSAVSSSASLASHRFQPVQTVPRLFQAASAVSPNPKRTAQ